MQINMKEKCFYKRESRKLQFPSYTSASEYYAVTYFSCQFGRIYFFTNFIPKVNYYPSVYK